MENSGMGGFLRNRRFESYVDASSAGPKLVAKEKVVEQPPQTAESDEYRGDDGWFSVFISWIRIVVCFISMMFTTFIWALIMLVLLPWPYQRIRQGNIYGHVTGKMLMWILGNPIKIEGAEYSNERAIYISNHASPIDIFLLMWLTPTGTVGIAKKEAANGVVKNNLSLIIFPEGTRSKSGHLLPFKKGFVHLALQTRRPIVPIVLTGTHRAWRKGSLHVRSTPITVKYLPPITTDDWTADKVEDYVKLVHDVYVKNLPESQRPQP
ncbi:1-acyl-sn-glycerol-3-phosphate acyltransferase [Abeliophyllum distichum]|uniref:1-acyl-sn-glycerol-3-phosphate acyltransferase n=1 Tax=Abeliophyllum distichum TaxID=126358 RepID=A0ABD1QJB0_9LAMI